MRASAFEPPLRLFLYRSEDQGGPSSAQRRRAREPAEDVLDADALIGDPMHRFAPSPRRTDWRLAAALILGALAGCAEPTALARPTPPSAIIIIGGHPIVFTAQLRAIGNPDEKPLNAVVGTIQLLITGSEETGFVVSWQAHFANPECEATTSFGGGDVMIQDSEDTPNPEGLVAFRLLPPGTPLGCGDSFLEGSSSITESLVALMYSDPEEFVAVFFLQDGGVIFGTLQLAGPDQLSTR
jgi:hypothetical protein